MVSKPKFSVFHSKKISIPFSISFHGSVISVTHSPGKPMSFLLVKKVMRVFWSKMKFLNFWCSLQGKGSSEFNKCLHKKPNSSSNSPRETFPESNFSLTCKCSTTSVLKVNLFWFSWIRMDFLEEMSLMSSRGSGLEFQVFMKHALSCVFSSWLWALEITFL